MIPGPFFGSVLFSYYDPRFGGGLWLRSQIRRALLVYNASHSIAKRRISDSQSYDHGLGVTVTGT